MDNLAYKVEARCIAGEHADIINYSHIGAIVHNISGGKPMTKKQAEQARDELRIAFPRIQFVVVVAKPKSSK